MKHILKPRPRFNLLEGLRKSIGRKACLIALLLAVPLAQVPAQQVSNPAASPTDAKTVDVGEEYTIKVGKKFTIAVGGTILVMNADGSIAITGKTVNITAQGANTIINGDKVLINPAGVGAAVQPSGGDS